MNLNKLTKKQLLSEIKNLNARDSAWVRDYNKLQKKLDKADLEIYDLKKIGEKDVNEKMIFIKFFCSPTQET